ncbi:MAG: hypothetical protein LC772_06795 [Chloroflexi bacterium]|nr:hypothetical protein [Chloroflexota bacterium]
MRPDRVIHKRVQSRHGAYIRVIRLTDDPACLLAWERAYELLGEAMDRDRARKEQQRRERDEQQSEQQPEQQRPAA